METQAFAVTVIVVTYNRPNLFDRALRTMAQAASFVDYKIDLKILINGEDAGSLRIAEQIKSEFEFLNTEIKTLKNCVTPAEGRNLLVEKLAAHWFFFMDDDVQVPTEIFKNFEKLCQQSPQYEAWGGPNLTPLASDFSAQQNGWYVENPMIVGLVSQRYRKRGLSQGRGGQFNLMLCNLFVKAHVFINDRFASHLKTAEENDLIYRMQDRKMKLGYSDELLVWHERRANLKTFLKQIHYYGFGRGQLLVSGSFYSQWYFALYPMFFLALLLTFLNWPIQLGSLITIWLLAIQISYLIKFKKLSIQAVWVPLAIWGLYSVGLIKGFWDGSKDYLEGKKKGDLKILIKN